MITFFVYRAGANFDINLAPFGPDLVFGTPDEAEAITKAGEIGGSVERWMHGEVPAIVSITEEKAP